MRVSPPLDDDPFDDPPELELPEPEVLLRGVPLLLPSDEGRVYPLPRTMRPRCSRGVSTVCDGRTMTTGPPYQLPV